ncbi:MAG: 50S ribosomal protein L11 methyltransferase [Fimbriimonadales bacterium]
MQEKPHWLCVQVVAPPPVWDAVAMVLLDAGCAGVELREAPPSIVAYLPEFATTQVEQIQQRLNAFADLGLPPVQKVVVETVADQEWHTLWRRHFRSRKYGNTLRVQPTWSKRRPKPGERVIHLDPGLAFGTGGHPTTALCLALCEAYVREGMRVADMGTGTGILSIACALLGAQQVVAVDNDELSVKIAQANVDRNRVADRVQVHLGDGWSVLEEAYADHRFDVIVCNIISTFLIETAPRVPPLLKSGGYYIVSGTIGRNWQGVRKALEAVGFELRERRKRRTWVAGVFQKRTD